WRTDGRSELLKRSNDGPFHGNTFRTPKSCGRLACGAFALPPGDRGPDLAQTEVAPTATAGFRRVVRSARPAVGNVLHAHDGKSVESEWRDERSLDRRQSPLCGGSDQNPARRVDIRGLAGKCSNAADLCCIV